MDWPPRERRATALARTEADTDTERYILMGDDGKRNQTHIQTHTQRTRTVSDVCATRLATATCDMSTNEYIGLYRV